MTPPMACMGVHSRCRDDDFSIDQFLIELGVLALLVGGGDQGVALILEPFPDPELILRCSQKLWYFFGVLAALS